MNNDTNIDINVLKEYTEIDEHKLEEENLTLAGKTMNVGLAVSKAHNQYDIAEFKYKKVRSQIGIYFRENHISLGFLEKSERLVEDWVNNNEEVKQSYKKVLNAKQKWEDLKAIQNSMIDVRKALENISTLINKGLYVPSTI